MDKIDALLAKVSKNDTQLLQQVLTAQHELRGLMVRHEEAFYEQGRQGVQRGKLNKCFDITVTELLQKLSQSQDTKPWWRFW